MNKKITLKLEEVEEENEGNEDELQQDQSEERKAKQSPFGSELHAEVKINRIRKRSEQYEHEKPTLENQKLFFNTVSGDGNSEDNHEVQIGRSRNVLYKTSFSQQNVL